MELFDEVHNVVEKLNTEINEYMKTLPLSFYPILEVQTDGILITVNFLGQTCLWFSGEDKRIFDEDRSEYEPLEQYLRREGQKIIDRISTLKLQK